jgi:acyl-CoA synthetase (AMP-forming)/AMP-acid ligase II
MTAADRQVRALATETQTERSVWTRSREQSADDSVIGLTTRTMSDLLRTRSARQPERVAYIFLEDGESTEASLSYAELDCQARRIAAAILEVAGPGERALLLYPTGLDFISAFFGCLYAGVIPVPAYPPTPARGHERLSKIAIDSRARLALTTSRVSQRAAFRAMERELGALSLCTDLALSEPRGGSLPKIEDNSIAFIQYTSGSTQDPRGVIVTHQSLLANEELIRNGFGLSASSVIVGWLPLYHDMGLIGNVLQSLYLGARCVLLSPFDFVQRPLRWLKAISKYRGTCSGGPNFAYDMCVRKIGEAQRRELDLRSWTVAFNGSEPVRNETMQRFAEYFEPSGFSVRSFLPCYGLAEATLFVSAGPAGRAYVTKNLDRSALSRNEVHETDQKAGATAVSCGEIAPAGRVRIVDPNSRKSLPPGAVGEIWVCGDAVAKGYWRRARESKETFEAFLGNTGEGPFLRTGDMGFISEGLLFVKGRLKDIIIVRGRNLYPEDIEVTVERCHPSLRPGSCAAFSIDNEGEERLIVVNELEFKQGVDVSEIGPIVHRAIAAEHDIQLHVLMLIEAGTIPKTSSGKIKHKECRDLFLQRLLPSVGEWHKTGNAPLSMQKPESLG